MERETKMTVGGNQRVLVTGGAGFIGTALCHAWLGQGASVMALDDFSAGNTRLLAAKHENLQLIRGAVEDFSTIRGLVAAFRPTLVYHLAAVHYIPTCEAEPLRALEVNVKGTESVLLAAGEAFFDQLVLPSTASVYAYSDQTYK